MARIKCPDCGLDVSTSARECPHCGAPADNIRKAAAGLDSLLALGDVLHDHDSSGDPRASGKLRYARMQNEVKELWDAWLHGGMDEELKEEIDRREKEMWKMAIDLGLHGTGDLSPRDRERYKRDIDEGREPGSSGGCFISSAVAQGLGWPDDCAELNLLRHFRNSYMRATADRQAEVERYYRIAPAIVRAINEREDALVIWRGIARDYVLNAVTLINEGRLSCAHSTYRRMVADLETRYVGRSRT